MAIEELVPIFRGILAPQNSRFKKTNLLRDDNVEWFETYEFGDVPYTDVDIYHEVGPGETSRLDLISFEYYGTVDYWWLIAEANDIYFPLTDVVAGMTLRIPPLEVAYNRNVS